MDDRISASAAAFDAIASRYDDMFSAAANPLIAMMRARVMRAVDRHFPEPATPPGDRLRHRRGRAGAGSSAATASSRAIRRPSMIATARAKVAAAGTAPLRRVRSRDGGDDRRHAGRRAGAPSTACSRTSRPLNCELSLAPLRLLLERSLRRGGRFIAVVLPALLPAGGRAVHGACRAARGVAPLPPRRDRGRRGPALRDEVLRRDATSTAALGTGFQRIETRSLGLFLPPLGFGNAFARVPGLLTALGAVEDRVSGLPGLRRMGDHVLLVYERV